MNVKHVIWASIMSTTISCQSVKKEYTSFEEYPIPEGKLVEMEYSPIETKFTLWAPTAEEVRVLLYDSGNEGSAYQTLSLEMGEDGIWNTSIKEDLKGKFYTFNVKVNGKWLGDTPGIMAKAVGVKIVEVLHKCPYSQNAAIIGEVTAEQPGKVVMTTEIGTQALLPQPGGELLPRIC